MLNFLSFSLVSPAHAAEGAVASSLFSFLPLLLVMGVLYFFLIMPQQKKVKEHKALIQNLKKGDTVVTSGGIIGVIEKISGHEVILATTPGTLLRVLKDAVSSVMDKTSGEVISASTKEAAKESESAPLKAKAAPKKAPKKSTWKTPPASS